MYLYTIEDLKKKINYMSNILLYNKYKIIKCKIIFNMI
jgi:hypothetical protein